MLAQVTAGLIEGANRVVQLPLAHGGGSHNETAIFDSFRDGLELLGFGKQRRGTNGGTRLAKSQFVRVYYAKMEKTKVAHGAGGGADVEGVARGHKHHPQAVGFGMG
jgi:hypothetical protein